MPACSVREAGPEDLPALVEMGRRFHAAANAPGGFDEISFAASCASLMASPEGIVLFAEKAGMAGALLYPHFYNAHVLTCQELFWWVEPGYRLGRRLRVGIEAWAREKGAKTITMICLESLRPETVGRLYERAGYRAQEHSYVKAL